MYEKFDPLRRSHLKPRFVQNGLSVLSEVFRIPIEINEKWKYLSMNHSRLQRCANCLQVVCKAYANYMLILAQLTRPAKQEPELYENKHFLAQPPRTTPSLWRETNPSLTVSRLSKGTWGRGCIARGPEGVLG